jgi:hypothetical protein
VSSVSDEPVPKLPRGRGMKFSGPELFRIALTLILLVAIIVLTRPCAGAVSDLVMTFDGDQPGSAMPRPGTVDKPADKPAAQPVPRDDYELLTPDMTDDEKRAAIERARARSAAGGAEDSAGSGEGTARPTGPDPAPGTGPGSQRP